MIQTWHHWRAPGQWWWVSSMWHNSTQIYAKYMRKPRFACGWPGHLPWSFIWESQDLLADGQVIYLDLSLEKAKICLWMARWFTLIFHLRKPRFACGWPGDLPWSFTWESQDLRADGQVIYLDLSLEKAKICLQMARWFTLIFHLRKPKFACRWPGDLPWSFTLIVSASFSSQQKTCYGRHLFSCIPDRIFCDFHWIWQILSYIAFFDLLDR